VWDRVHADLLRLLRQRGQLDPDTAVVDGVVVRAFGGGDGTGPVRWTAGNPARSTPS
jgi:hypothetical protein